MSKKIGTSVEMTMLGMTFLRGPCTVYSVMKELSASESTFYRSRAGTAYQSIKRLIERGWVERVQGDLVQTTREGEAVLSQWVGPDVPMMDVAHSADLLRLRCFFLESLPPLQRLEFIDISLQKLEQFLTRCEGLIAENQAIGEYYGALATLCSVKETRARIDWLQQIRPLVENPLPKNEEWAEILLRL